MVGSITETKESNIKIIVYVYNYMYNCVYLLNCLAIQIFLNCLPKQLLPIKSFEIVWTFWNNLFLSKPKSSWRVIYFLTEVYYKS